MVTVLLGRASLQWSQNIETNVPKNQETATEVSSDREVAEVFLILHIIPFFNVIPRR